MKFSIEEIGFLSIAASFSSLIELEMFLRKSMAFDGTDLAKAMAFIRRHSKIDGDQYALNLDDSRPSASLSILQSQNKVVFTILSDIFKSFDFRDSTQRVYWADRVLDDVRTFGEPDVLRALQETMASTTVKNPWSYYRAILNSIGISEEKQSVQANELRVKYLT